MINFWLHRVCALALSALRRALPVITLAALCNLAQASLGMTELAATPSGGPVTIFYPCGDQAHPVKRGRFVLDVSEQGAPVRGNGRLIVISHGSGGSPWVHTTLARDLVEAGFVVAFPEHHADNYKDDSDPGPDSWTIRPMEVSRAIDSVGRDARFAPMLELDKVGVYGMSAGGHTALELAGGRWSPGRFKKHCEDNLAEDFQACVGLIMRLKGNVFDGIKEWGALVVIRHRFSDEAMRSYTEPRVAAVVAGVPFAADFDMTSFESLAVPLGLITAAQDRWLVPRFHSDRVLAACKQCEHIGHIPDGGHGALLSPIPSGFTGLLGDLLNDPPGFDRSRMPEIDRKTTAFFVSHLTPLPPPSIARPLARPSSVN